jgi:hypothetical protein
VALHDIAAALTPLFQSIIMACRPLLLVLALGLACVAAVRVKVSPDPGEARYVRGDAVVAWLIPPPSRGDEALWYTFYPLAGADIVKVDAVEVDSDEQKAVDLPPMPHAWIGCGPGGCGQEGVNGSVAELIQDTGMRVRRGVLL